MHAVALQDKNAQSGTIVQEHAEQQGSTRPCRVARQYKMVQSGRAVQECSEWKAGARVQSGKAVQEIAGRHAV
jgi:hypothetical protein